MIKELVTFVVEQLVSQPHNVIITDIKKGDLALLEIKVAPEDRGRVIGKEGQTIKALRVLVDSIAKEKVLLELSR